MYPNECYLELEEDARWMLSLAGPDFGTGIGRTRLGKPGRERPDAELLDSVGDLD